MTPCLILNRVAICLFLVFAWSATPAAGQFTRMQGADQLGIQQPANLFASWSGQTPINGVYVSLPAGWKLNQASVLRADYAPVQATVRRLQEGENGYMILSDRLLEGPLKFVLQVETGDVAGDAVWALTPFTRVTNDGISRMERRDAFRSEKPMRLQQPAALSENRSLVFEDATTPLLLRPNALPDLGARAPHTVEFWMKTTGLDEVVLSTWNGREQEAYPFEIIIDAAGRLFYYQGQPGQHFSMMTRTPVADGRWHHIALGHDPERGWTHLYLDGAVTDSLYVPVPLAVNLRGPVAVGGRVPAEKPVPSYLGVFSGALDELRFWPKVRSAVSIRQTLRQPLRLQQPGTVILGFEEPLPKALVARPASGAEVRPSDLTFHQPIRNLQVSMEPHTILLSWETTDLQTTGFLIERSTDGHTFEPVGQVDFREGLRAAGDPVATFSFRNRELAAQVLFYRVRQQFTNGTDRLSSMIKIGMGEETQAQRATLIGNFPNPFNPTTTITYTLREPQHVRVSVWDLSGQQVTVLVDEYQGNGYYEVPFEAQDLPSGTYFIQLQTTDGVQSRQMILTK